ncbi:NCS1 allantoate transporter [Blastomyces dermatitidis ER-3]|uniref:NCS1 allantoate transporter n=1 Tax=Ajellomyces dermatitidis (strain ER-3 / ATCC MYA-2586) TaxID=559297 RepID=A0ABX2VWV9_AJEDR|nr:NCS1 allantoate transporter [Blastomyces dermatitidis ER-3]OAT01637.1 NCS1 allantoate transporter [Blastomyces dermatitidis ER-3]
MPIEKKSSTKSNATSCRMKMKKNLSIRWESLKRAAVVPIDENAHYENGTWCNRDLIPIPPERRTWGVWGYFGYWTVSGSCIFAWTIGSTLLAFGLSPQQAIACVVVGGILTGLLAVACGWMGERQQIGFTVASRFSWGMRGSYFPVLLRAFVGSMWFGMQSFWGGQATRVLIGAIIPGFAHMKNYFAESSHLTTNDFIGVVIWYAAFIPLCLIPPERLQKPFAISFVLFASSCIGMLIWGVENAHGPGSMFHKPASTPSVTWGMLYGISAILGAWGAGTLAQSDWTRYANRPLAPTLSQLVAAPVTIAVTAIVGIIVTSAANDLLGEIMWNPIYLIAAIQEEYESSARARVGVFFASVGMVATQLAISVVLNSISTGMDMAGLCPKYINIVRGSYIMAFIGFCSQPWQLLATATKFLSVVSGFGIFMASLTGIMLADYHVIRRHKLKIDDLYTGDPGSIYWYWHGFNWRAVVAFVSGVWPLFPGLIASINNITHPGLANWIKLFNLTFFVGLAVSFASMATVCYIWPPRGLGEEAPFISHMQRADGVDSVLVGREDIAAGQGRSGLDGVVRVDLKDDGALRGVERVV